MPRRTVFSRKEPWLAAKSRCSPRTRTPFFVTTALTPADFKPRRLERYLATAWESGAQPAIVLTKTDLCPDVEAAVLEVEAVAFGVPIHTVNGLTGEGVAELSPYLAGDRTVALLGSSGVGKSTIVNHLAGRHRNAGCRDRKRRTGVVTRRAIASCCRCREAGSCSIRPGLREVQLWDVSQGSRADLRGRGRACLDLPLRRLRARERAGLRASARRFRAGLCRRERFDSWRKLQRELGRARAAPRRRVPARSTRSRSGRRPRQRRRTQRPPEAARWS